MAHPLIENGPPQQVIASAGVDLVTPLGDPVVPQDILRRVKNISPRYDIRWVNGAWGMSYFGLFEEWSERDKRWEWVQRGAHDRNKAFDLVYMFPVGCTPHEMAAYVDQRFGRRGLDPKAEADRMVAEAAKLYQQAQDEAVDKTVDASMERHVRESKHDLAVRSGNASPTPMADVKIDLGGPKRLIPKE